MMKKINKLKIILKFSLLIIIFNVIRLLSKRNPNIEDKTILLIRLDAIGDYILFRNFIKILKESKKYKDYKITLLGNIKWKELAEFLDSKYVERFIWLDPVKFSKNIFYCYSKLKEITSKGYEIVINPVWSRTYEMDYIVKIVRAKQKIGYKGDITNIIKLIKKFSDKYYDLLVDGEEGIVFEFYRNKYFFEKLLDCEIKIEKPYIDINFERSDLKNFEISDNSSYCILFIGAGANFRKWPVENFAQIANYLKSKYECEIVLCGGKEDIESTKNFEKIYKGRYTNLVGKTSLVDIMFILSRAKLLITNETFIHHLAVALNVKNIIVISNGNHFGRFVPYPEEIAKSLNHFTIFPPEINENITNFQELINLYGYGSKLNISKITVDEVKKVIDKILFND